MPQYGDVFADVRGGNRTMRVSYHGDRDAVVVSLWAGALCRGSFRMAAGDVSRLISTLNEIKQSFDPAPTTNPGGSTPEPVGLGSEATAVADAPDPAEQTGDIAGHADRSLPSSAPVLGVA